MQGLNNVKLVQVFKVQFKELSEVFLHMDAAQTGGTYYQFRFDPEEVVLCLAFADPATYRMFLTVRSHSDQKEAYYRDEVGELFEIVRGG